MTNIRLLPVVVLAISALLVLKTIGLVTSGGYVLGGVTEAQAAGGGGAAGGAVVEADSSITPASEPTMEDTSPVLADPAPTLAAETAAGGEHGAVAAEHGEPAPAEAGDHAAPAEQGAAPVIADSTFCVEANATITDSGTPPAAEGAAAGGHGGTAEAPVDPVAAEAAAADAAAFAKSVAVDCLPSGDAVPLQINGDGTTTPLVASDGSTLTEQQLLERLAARRTELEKYEQDLALRASIVDAAEKRIEERTATLQALEQQIGTLVQQREEMETGQFAGIVAMYEAMKPKDAANIFNNLEMTVLLRVAQTMSPRKMAPILAEMDPARAQELTVKMANLSDQPSDQMTPEDLAALPQIVGQ